MRSPHLPALAAATLALLVTAGPAPGQPPPGGGDAPKRQDPKPPPDEFRALLKEIEEAYKAPREVDKDVLDELRKQYRDPTPEREAKILREVRRLYRTTPEHEEAIIREVRRAYDRPTPEQEDRIFREIRRHGTLPPGTVPAAVQADRAAKLFAGFDRNGDARLAPDEAPAVLRDEWRRWDGNRDGAVDREEYAAYYRTQLERVGDKVAAGEVPLKLPKGSAVPEPAPARPANPDPAPREAKAPPKLPAWFIELDADRDGQIQLHEWRRAGRPIPEFLVMDLDGDGLLPVDEYRRYLSQNPPAESSSAGKTPEPQGGMAAKGNPPGGGKK